MDQMKKLWAALAEDSKFTPVLVYCVLGGISVILYSASSCLSYRCGFPLDDAWIHQTYARNLAHSLEWSFLPGKPSTGSTSPLWTVLLAPGYWLGLNPLIWSNLLGWLLLVGLSLLAYHGIRVLFPDFKRYAIWMGVVVCFEWHMVWAAVSGMETLLAATIYFLALLYMLKPGHSWWITGFLAGMCVWVRPDGITILLLAAICLWTSRTTNRKWIFDTINLGLGFLIVILPYLLLIYLISGDWLPATFYAKQAEYAELQSTSIVSRVLQQASLPLIGVGVLLLPGFLYSLAASIIKRQWWQVAAMVWIFAFGLLYAIRLPVTYQHGRYLMPAMPVFWFWGLIGSIYMIHSMKFHYLYARVLTRSWLLSMVLLLVVFWVLGSTAVARDVRFIESEMVDTAVWIENNTNQDTRIAAHDIGAMGYYSNRYILDLAGLINPEVIPFIRQQERLGEYLEENDVDYLVTFPGWYPELGKNLPVVYRNEQGYSPVLGGENMVVYQWTSQFR